MNIKDFKPGQEVYVFSTKSGWTVNHTAKKYIVRSVGRKYVKVSTEDFPDTVIEFFKKKGADENYLTENQDWGDKRRLFISLQAANDEIEKEALIKWLRVATSWGRIESYSLRQLRAAKQALERKEDSNRESK